MLDTRAAQSARLQWRAARTQMRLERTHALTQRSAALMEATAWRIKPQRNPVADGRVFRH